MATGTVKWFDQKKGFGFIINADGKDVFVHYSCIEGDGFRALKDGWTVEYEEIKGDKGLSAKTVHRVGGDERQMPPMPFPPPPQQQRKFAAAK
jgi:cold shock protein